MHVALLLLPALSVNLLAQTAALTPLEKEFQDSFADLHIKIESAIDKLEMVHAAIE